MSTEAPKLLERLLRGEHLDEATASELLRTLARGELAPALAGALLAALRAKGETADEIRGFARAMRELALRPSIAPGAYVDIVGTELVFEVPAQGDWAILALQRLLAFSLLLAHGRFGERPSLTYGHRVPLGGSIDLDSSELRNVFFAQPTHYAASFDLESGRVDLLHTVGISDAELEFAEENDNEALIKALSSRGAFPVTDPRRASVV